MVISRQGLSDQLVDLMQQTHVLMRTGAAEEWSDIELTMTQFRSLLLLRGGPQRMGNIASYLESSLSSATSLIDRLVEKGLITRASDPTDRRVVECLLTDEGRQVMEKCWQISRRSITEIAEHLDEDELEVVVHAMKHLHRASLKVREELKPSVSVVEGAAG